MTGMIGSESIASRTTGTPLIRRALRTWLVLGLVSMLITLSACGGGGVNGTNGPSTLTVMVNSVSTVTSGAGDSAVRVNFTVQGDTGQAFSLLFQYFVDTNADGMLNGSETLLNMTEVSMALETALGLTSRGDISGFTSGQNMVSDLFLWQAGADLGFIGSPFGVVVTPSTAVANQSVMAGSTSSAVTYSAGNPPAVFSGSVGAAGVSGTGRTAHSAAGVSDLGASAALTDLGNEILVIGGNNGTSDLNNIDRFTIDGNTRTSMANGTFTSANVRIQHASASYFGGTNGTSQRVLVTGGSIGGTATNTADIYTFGPNGVESVAATGNMNGARRLHGACWLPDNRIFVHGGFDGSNTAVNTAEIFDSSTGTFTALTVPGTVPARVQHTHCVLPNGMVLVAGGHDGSNNPLNAFLYNPMTDTWTDTGTQVDRVGHSATMLVNGVCALIGGRNAGSTAALSTATFYRTFAENDNGTMIPAGFTTIAISNPSTARADHGASRLANGGVLVSGGFGSSNNTLASSELFVPSKFTDPAIGFFTQTNPGAVAGMDMVDSRANHTQTTTATGSAVVIGGVTGSTSTNTVLSTIEVFQFQNSAPTVSAVSAVTTNANDVPISFTLADAEADRSFVVIRFSQDGGATFKFATLTDYASTVNLAPGTIVLHWNAAADGVTVPAGTLIEIIPVGGVLGAPVRANI